MKRHRLGRNELILVIFPLILLSFPLWRGIFADKFDKNLQRLAGPEAVDLGHSRHNLVHWEDIQRQCVEAFEKKTPFYARYDTLFYSNDWDDESCWGYQGIAGNAKGEIYFVYYFPAWSHHKTYRAKTISLSKPSHTWAIRIKPYFEQPFPFDEPQTCPCR